MSTHGDAKNMFDRETIRFLPLKKRKNKIFIERDHTPPDSQPRAFAPEVQAGIRDAAAAIREARRKDRPVILAFGAHAVKNGLSPIIIGLIEQGWVTHLATNGAGIIHDWEFAFQGASSEDVKENIALGRFGLWQETGYYLNLALIAGAYDGLGYGESVGRLVHDDGLAIPEEGTLRAAMRAACDAEPAEDMADKESAILEKAAAAADFLTAVRRFKLNSGFLSVPHAYKRFGLQAAAFRLGIPFTAHPMFGHDIIYSHPMNLGAAVGRTAERDFLRFVSSVRRLQEGVYLSVGSAVMSPMIFEKALSMARNVSLQAGQGIDDFSIYVVDLAAATWNWRGQGEPPPDNAAYYLRYCKTFNRVGGRMSYLAADNRDFLLGLYVELERGN
jgi:hypothetical protein